MRSTNAKPWLRGQGFTGHSRWVARGEKYSGIIVFPVPPRRNRHGTDYLGHDLVSEISSRWFTCTECGHLWLPVIENHFERRCRGCFENDRQIEQHHQQVMAAGRHLGAEEAE